MNVLAAQKLNFVNRLDKLVSGLMLASPSAKAAAALMELFKHRNLLKMYCACISNPNNLEGCYAVYSEIIIEQKNVRGSIF